MTPIKSIHSFTCFPEKSFSFWSIISTDLLVYFFCSLWFILLLLSTTPSILSIFQKQKNQKSSHPCIIQCAFDHGNGVSIVDVFDYKIALTYKLKLWKILCSFWIFISFLIALRWASMSKEKSNPFSLALFSSEALSIYYTRTHIKTHIWTCSNSLDFMSRIWFH